MGSSPIKEETKTLPQEIHISGNQKINKIKKMQPNKTFEEFLSEAIAATRATTRGRKITGAAQKITAQNDRREEARARQREREAQRQRDIEYAQERRANPELIKKEARKRTLPSRMERAAQKLGL